VKPCARRSLLITLIRTGAALPTTLAVCCDTVEGEALDLFVRYLAVCALHSRS